ncbi:GGDEF domain-containing protein [Pseudoluteimonas lycopersici]|uniref:diguanylate cyclase n=2 Tax=Pseudoluteimonas lycopersici TaxID=1324796 RepID=A0A516V4Z0_9GAMM|nr:GGDEF domain-containing protein [Lysobacter lycopersici]
MLAAGDTGRAMGLRGTFLWLKDLVGALLARPDELMLELGAGGELLVARLRALLSVTALLLPIASAMSGGSTSETIVGLGAVVFINICAQIWLALANRPRTYPWLPYATTTYDVTTTTGVLALLALGDPVSGVNSLIVWCFYLISIAMTALRNDGRLTLYAGALAIVEYGLLAWAILASHPQPLSSPDYGIASAGSQVERLVLLGMMTMLTSVIVYRMQRLVELSGNDGLTGLPNRSWLLQRMPRIFDKVRDGGGSLTLALIDLDHFKRVNDDIGHLAANRTLRQVAALMSDALGPGERLVRIGGQEFVALLHCPIGSAWERIDRLRRAMSEQVFLGERGTPGPRLTFSAGIATWPQDGNNLSLLLRSADRRLQVGKRDGRNRVIARDV